MVFINGNPRNKFTLIPNNLLRDKNLSDAACRLICWVASHNDEFDISFRSVEIGLGYGREKIRGAIASAEKNGYLIRKQQRDTKTGQYRWHYYVYSEKIPDDYDPTGEPTEYDLSDGELPRGGKPAGGQITPVYKKNKEKKTKLEKDYLREEEQFDSLAFQPDADTSSEAEIVEVEVCLPSIQPEPIQQQEPIKATESLNNPSGDARVLALRELSPVASLGETPRPHWPHQAGQALATVPASENDNQSRNEDKLTNFRDAMRNGGNLTSFDRDAVAFADLGASVIAMYRKSGRISTTKRGDIDPDFAMYIAKQFTGKGAAKDIDYGYQRIKSLEANPDNYETLAAYIAKWEAFKATGDCNINIAKRYERSMQKPKYDYSKMKLT